MFALFGWESQEGTGNEKGAESLFKERMIENFPNHGKEMNIKRSLPRHIIIKLLKRFLMQQKKSDLDVSLLFFLLLLLSLSLLP